ncbi:MAG: ATP-binding cassette domain-containing protein [Planctomycetota bacterium]
MPLGPPVIEIQDLTTAAGQFRLTGVSFSVADRAYAVLMGATGSGKTTLLETICGLRRAESGTIRLGGQDVSNWPPAARRVGYVPQEGAVFPRMTVRENLAFGLRMAGRPRREREERAEQLAALLGVSALLDRRATRLSGGETQRVALGRALATRPQVLILDEPLSALDEATHAQMLELLQTVRKEAPVTILHVTHNRHEAEQLADTRLLIERGRVAMECEANASEPRSTNRAPHASDELTGASA